MVAEYEHGGGGGDGGVEEVVILFHWGRGSEYRLWEECDWQRVREGNWDPEEEVVVVMMAEEEVVVEEAVAVEAAEVEKVTS